MSKSYYFGILAAGILMATTSTLNRFVNRSVLVLMAVLLGNISALAQKEILVERSFTCWNEATQRDTTLLLYAKYGKVVSTTPQKIISFDINMPHGNPHISAVSALFGFSCNVIATQGEKILGKEHKQTYNDASIQVEMECLRQTFVKVKEMYERWSETAKKEHVTNYHKTMTDKEIFDVPCIFRCFNHNQAFFHSTGLSQKDVLKPEFIVDEEGNCKVFWGIVDGKDNYSPYFYNEQELAKYGGLIKKNITKSMTIRALKAGLWFTSPEQIQSLIDALDYESIDKEGKEKYNKTDSRDELFK